MITKIKKATRFISEIKKSPRRNLYPVKPVLVILSVLFSIQLGGYTISDYTADISSPFHDIFNAYDSSQADLAKKLLRKQFRKKLKNQAYINYALILQNEENFTEAEKYFRKALSNNEMTALIYLHNHYRNHDRDKTIPLLEAVEKNIKSPWIDYEKAVHYAEAGNKEAVYYYLEQAADKGFSSAGLLRKDTAFDAVRNTYRFRRIIKSAEMNSPLSASVNTTADRLIHEYEHDKPFGKSIVLSAAAYFERTGNERKALKIISSVLESGPAFRDRGIALFWAARISARKGNMRTAKKYLDDFIRHITGNEKDDTGFKELISPFYTDLILNDRYLRKLAGTLK